MAGKTGYSGLQIALHWAVAGLIAANWLFSEGMGRFLDQRLDGEAVTALLPTFHVYAGITILVLAVIRLGVRLAQGAPSAAAASLADLVAVWTHRALYALIFLVPLAGAVAWFAGVEEAGDAHELLMNLMMVLVILHGLGALYHQFVVKDGLLTRMVRPD